MVDGMGQMAPATVIRAAGGLEQTAVHLIRSRKRPEQCLVAGLVRSPAPSRRGAPVLAHPLAADSLERISSTPRVDWQHKADQYGFKFHTMYGEPYWDESAYYCFSLEQIENDIEDPTEELHQLCLEVVDRVVADEKLLRRFQIPERYWELVRASWDAREPSLYSRLDLAYDGKGSAKLYENNADTPTSLYETGFWQWLWLEDKIKQGELPADVDQFNSLQEKLINRFIEMRQSRSDLILHLSCCKDTDEDRGTVQYLQDCATQAGISCKFVFVEDIGYGSGNWLTDLDDKTIEWMFKLYPWEFMYRESYGPLLLQSGVRWIEPYWKSILSNKALLPMLWNLNPGHSNLLATYFEDDPKRHELDSYVKKPIFAREGSNVELVIDGDTVVNVEGPYGEEGFIFQGYCPLPEFDGNYTLIGSWLVDDQAAGISVREDESLVTQDLSRYLPHVILPASGSINQNS